MTNQLFRISIQMSMFIDEYFLQCSGLLLISAQQHETESVVGNYRNLVKIGGFTFITIDKLCD